LPGGVGEYRRGVGRLAIATGITVIEVAGAPHQHAVGVVQCVHTVGVSIGGGSTGGVRPVGSRTGVEPVGVTQRHHIVAWRVGGIVHTGLGQIGALIPAQSAVGAILAGYDDIETADITTPQHLDGLFIVVAAIVLLTVELHLHAIIGSVRNEVDHAGHRFVSVQRRSTVSHDINSLDGNGGQHHVDVLIGNALAVQQCQGRSGTQAA